MSMLSFAQPVQRSTTVAVAVFPPNEIDIFLPQRGLLLGLGPLEAASYRICETATMKSESWLVMPQEPKPVEKKVPSPSVKGPLLPPVLGGCVFAGAGGEEVVFGAGGDCLCETGVGEGVGVGVVAGGATTGVFWTMGVFWTAGVEEEVCARLMHFGEFCRLTVTSEEFEGAEATRAATARAATARRWRA